MHLLRKLDGQRGAWLIACIASVLSARSLTLGLVADDHWHHVTARLDHRPFGLFYTSPEFVATGRANGSFAWWSSPSFSLRFFRPLCSLWHAVEYQLWPDAPWAMHLTNIVLYVLLVVVVLQLYRELLPEHSRLAALAALMFAIDDGHAPSVGCIAGRNTLLAALLGMTALFLHVRWRARFARFARFASPACLALALCSAEAALGIGAYFAAYVLVYESGTTWQRLCSVGPQLAVFALWALVYVALGCGAHNVIFYRDLGQPLSLLANGSGDIGIWLSSLFGFSTVSPLMLLPTLPTRIGFALLSVPLLAALWLAVPRTRANHFFACGALLSLPALFTVQPQERLLIQASFGAFGLIASLILAVPRQAGRFLRVMRGIMIVLHLALAPLFFLVSLEQIGSLDANVSALVALLPSKPPSQVILVNTPVELQGFYARYMLREAGHALPRSMHQLYSGSSKLLLERIDATTLEVRAVDGWGHRPLERIFAGSSDLPGPGSELAVADMRVSVLEANDEGNPTRAQFRFATPLEAQDRLWIIWQGWMPTLWRPPAIGSTSETL